MISHLAGFLGRAQPPQPAPEPTDTRQPAPEALRPSERLLSMPAVDVDDLYPTVRDRPAHHGRCCWNCGWPGPSFCPGKDCRNQRRVSSIADAAEAQARLLREQRDRARAQASGSAA